MLANRLAVASFCFPMLVLAAGAFAGDAHGSEKAGVLPSINQGIVSAIVALGVFLVVFAILSLKVWPTIVKGLKDRENKIREEIESAEMARQQAKDALEQYQQSLAQARAEAQKMIEQAKAQQLAVAAEQKARMDAELSQMREKAMKDIEQAKRAAVSELYEHSTQLATTMASKIIGRTVTVQDTDKLFQESLRQLESMRS